MGLRAKFQRVVGSSVTFVAGGAITLTNPKEKGL